MPITFTSYIFNVVVSCFSAYQIVEVSRLIEHDTLIFLYFEF
jgi:hypothetical protein